MDPDVARLLARTIGPGVFMSVVSLALLVRLWWIGELYGVGGRVFCCWFLLAVAVMIGGLFQIVSAASITLWVLGLAAQSLLALVLVLKEQLVDV